MMRIRLSTNAGKKVSRAIKLPDYYRSASGRISKRLAGAAVWYAKLSAPKFTRNLKKSIYKDRISKQNYIVGYGKEAQSYARFIEHGFTPHWIPIEWVQKHHRNPGARGKRVRHPRAFVLSKRSVSKGPLQSGLDYAQRKKSRIARRELRKVGGL